MTDTESKLSAAFLAALMITSVAAVALVAAPASAANTATTTDRANWYPNDDDTPPALGDGHPTSEDWSHGTIDITPAGGTTVFQGEEDIDSWTGPAADETATGDQNEGAEGESFSLDSTISRTQQTGLYTTSLSGDKLRVTEPDVGTLNVINSQGQKVSGEVQEDQTLLIKAGWNYRKAEDLSISVTDASGLEVQQVALTDDVSTLSSSQNNTLSGTPYDVLTAGSDNLNNEDQGIGSDANLFNGDAYWALNLDDLDAGAHTITVEGVDDLTFGEASDSTTIDVTAEDEATLSLDQDEATQGEKVSFTIEQSDAGLNHVVAIDEDDLRDGVNDPERVFEFAGDTELRHANTSNANFDHLYAVVQISSSTGVGVGRIDTQYLDDDSVDITLYDQNADWTPTQLNNSILAGGFPFQDDIDEATLDVNEGEIEITSPGATYVPGQEIDLNGTATVGMEDVGIYVRDQGDWQILAETNVDSNGEFEEEDVVLTTPGGLGLSPEQQSNTDGHSLIAIPDIYRFGGIDAVDADTDNDDEADGNLTSREFNSGTSSQRSLRIALPTLTAEFETYDGAVWNEDDLEVTGRSVGPDQLVALFTGEKGDVIADDFTVDSDDTFEEDWTLGGESVDPGPTHSISEGQVLGTILSTGRDGLFGDGEFTNVDPLASNEVVPATVNRFVNGANARHNGARTLSQLVEIFRGETIEDDGSDDLIVSERFRLTSSSGTSVNDIVPAEQSNATGINPIEVGETAVVRGTTHLKPDDNTIVVEVSNGTDANKIPVNTTDEWGFDGEWNVMIDVPTDVTPGTYTLEADDPDSTDSVALEIVAQGERGDLDVGDTEVLRNQIDELEGQVQQLQQRNQELNSTVSDLRDENAELESQINESETDGEDTGNATETGDEGQPGFTPVVAVLALISAALVALRRR